MATKSITTRIKNKVDSLATWQSSTGVLLNGEIALVRVPTGETYTNPVTGADEPVTELLMKVGDGTSTFANLPWLSAKAADVYDWAKAQDPSTVTVKYNNGSSWTSATLADILKDLDAVEAAVASKLSDITVTPNGTTGIVTNVEKNGVGGIKVTRSAVGADDIANSAVTTDKIANEAVTNAKLSTGISSDKIKIDSGTTAGTLSAKLTSMDAEITAAKNAANHDHPYLSNTTKYAAGATQNGAAVSANKVNSSLSIQLNGGAATTFDGSAVKSIDITPAAIGAATAGAVTELFGRVDTAEGEITNLKAAISGGVHFIGTTTTSAMKDGYTTQTIAVSGVSDTYKANKGDVVLYGEKEFIWTGSLWEELGDLTRVGTLETLVGSIHASKATENEFVTYIAKENNKLVAKTVRPTAANVSYGDSDVATKLASVDAEITAAKNAANHSHDAYVNQNAFSNIKVGSTTVAADTTTDTVEFVGTNVTITGTNGTGSTADKVEFKITKDNVTTALGYTPPTTDAVNAELANKASSTHNHGNITNAGTITTTALTDANKANTIVVTDTDNKITRMSPATVRTLIGAGTSNLTIGTTSTTAAAGNHSHSAHEARTTKIETDYVKYNSSTNMLYIGKDGADEIIFDCGGAV